jgi:hypothetical protein
MAAVPGLRSATWRIRRVGLDKSQTEEQQPMDVAIIPRVLLDKLVDDPERCIHLNVLVSHLVLFAGAALLVHHPGGLAFFPHVCLVQVLCGIPCPGCGVTRSALAFLAGDVGRAWTLNPAGPVLCAALAFQVPLRAVALRGACWSRYVVSTSRAMTIVVLIVLIATWLRQVT